jgi:hypothetical protein
VGSRMSLSTPKTVDVDVLRRDFPEHIKAKTYTEWVAYFLANHGVSLVNAAKYAKVCVDTFGVPGEEEQGTNEFGEVCP